MPFEMLRILNVFEEIRAGDFRNYPSYTGEHGRPRQEMSLALRADIPAAFTLLAK
jgi:hypothetical protein